MSWNRPKGQDLGSGSRQTGWEPGDTVVMTVGGGGIEI